MAQIETIGDVITKKGVTEKDGTIEPFWKLVDPKNKFSYSTCTKEWYRLSLTEQRKLYLYLLYRKWRGIDIYGEPYSIIMNCHPVPFNWNGHRGINSLIKENRVCRAKYNGSYGTYTWDEARLYEMTDIQKYNN